jgi:hypothetical protein
VKVKEKNKKTEENRRHGEKSRVEGVPEEGRERDEKEERRRRARRCVMLHVMLGDL